MKQKKFRPRQLSFRAALLLFCLLLATLGMAVGLHARYTAGAAASDGARVAKFEIKETGLDDVHGTDFLITANLVPGETTTKSLTIQNQSEVAVEYTITVKNMTGNLPLIFNVVANDASAAVSAMECDPVSKAYSCSARLDPNETAANSYTLQIIWPKEEKSTQYVGMVDTVKVSISAIQVD